MGIAISRRWGTCSGRLTRQGLCVLALCLSPSLATGTEPGPGEILVVDGSAAAVYRVDPVTGARTILSSASVGSGPAFISPVTIAVDGAGRLIVGDGSTTLVRVDPAIGNRTVVSSPSVGTGPTFYPQNIPWVALDTSGDCLVSSFAALFHVNSTTGNRTIRSSTNRTPDCQSPGFPYACCTGFHTSNGVYPCAPGVGTGGALERTSGVSQDAGGGYLMLGTGAQSTNGVVYRVEPLSGNRSVVNNSFTSAGAMALEADGSVLVLNAVWKAILRVNAATGAVGTVSQCADQSSCTVGTGPAFSSPFGLALGPGGAIFVTDNVLDAVLRVDPVTGNRTIVSSPSVGSGPGFTMPLGIAVVPAAGGSIPTLGALAAGLLGLALALAAVRRLRRA